MSVAAHAARTKFVTVQDTTYQQSSDTLQIFFRQGKTLWAPDYMNNDERLRAFVERFRALRNSD